MIGQWIVKAEFNEGIVLITTLSITFQVIPESIIGAVAPIGVALAAFIGYRYYRRRRRES